MIYCFDIDGTICSLQQDSNYMNAEPFEDVHTRINKLYEQGDTIILMSARGSVSGKDWTESTKKQLEKWDIKYHTLIMNQKPHADVFIDDKGVRAEEWRKSIQTKKVGFVAGAFDIIHPGYIHMFREAKIVCDHLVVALQQDPTLERPTKTKPILTAPERKEILLSLEYVDQVWVYKTEKDLYNLLADSSIDVRFLGDDYRDIDYTGKDLDHPIHYISREHGWSATKFKQRIKESLT